MSVIINKVVYLKIFQITLVQKPTIFYIKTLSFTNVMNIVMQKYRNKIL